MTRIFTCLSKGLATMIFVIVAQVAFGFSNPTFYSTNTNNKLQSEDLGGLTLSMASVNANQGDQVCLPITVNGFNEVIGMQFTINYDESALTYSSVTNFNLSGLSLANFGTPDNGQSPGTITLSWLDNTFAGITVSDNSPVFEVCFDVSAANATANVSFGSSPVAVEVIDVNENELAVTNSNATVTIGDGGGGGSGSGTLTLTMSDETVDQGNQVCVGLSADNFTDLIGLQFTIGYDPAVLDFASVGSFNLTGLSASNFGTPNTGTDDGVVTLSWTDNTFAGITVADNTQLFEVCFDANGGAGTSAITFLQSPVILEVIDVNENTLDTDTNNGSVTINGGGSGGGNGFTITISDESVDNGGSVCVDVTADDFIDIIGAQFTINYDAAALTFDNFSGFNLPGLSASNFGNPSAGTLTFSWIDNTFAGVTQPAGTVIFQACFTATGSDEAVDVTIGNSPVAVEILDVNENLVAATTNNGVVTIGSGNTGGGGGDGFTINVSDETVDNGGSVCVDVSVDDFIDIIGAQFTINYDASALTFDNFDGFNLPSLTGSNFGNPSAGTLTFSWIDNTFAGVTQPAGTVIFQACFTATGSDEAVDVTIGNSPVAVEILDANEDLVNATTNNGVVTIGSGNTGGGGDGFTINVSDETVDNGGSVCVDVSVDDFINIIGAQFTLNYDASALTFDNFAGFNLPGMTASNFGNPSAGTLTFSWIDNTFAGITQPAGTVIFQACFTATGSDEAVDVTIGNSPVAVEILDVDENLVNATTNNGVVTIGSGNTGGGGDGFTINVSDETVDNGGSVCVDVSVDDFIDIIGAQFTLNYDASTLTFDNFAGFNLPGMTASNFGNPSAGTLTFSWIDNTFAGITQPAGTVIFQACFTATGSDEAVDVTIGNSPVAVEILDADENLVNATTNNGVVTIGSGNTGGGGDGFTINVSDETVDNGGSVCVDVSVDDFIDIIGAQFTINYDASALTFDNFAGFNLPGMTASNFGNPSAGTLTFSWIDNTFAGITQPAGTVIFQACFTATGSDEAVDVTIGNSPVAVEILDADENLVNATTNNGVVTIGSGNTGGGGDGFTINVSDETVDNGGSVCVDISVDDFINIIGAQFTLNYDASALTFDNFAGFNLPGMTASNFGNPSAGTLTFSWIDNTFAGITQPAGTVIFQACFTATGSDEAVDVTIGNSPVAVEILDADENLVNATTNNGVVTIGSGNTGGGGDGFTINVSDETVDNGGSVCVDISVDDFINIIGAQFTLNYDASALTFDNFAGFNLPGMTASNFGNPSAGTLTFSWIDNTFAGITQPAGTVIFQACFTATGSDEAVDVTIGNSPVAVEILDVDENLVNATTNNGVVTIGSGNTGGGGDGFTINVSDEMVDNGGSVCVDVSVDDFIDIIGAQFTINYDASALTFDNFAGFNLPGMTASNFGNPSAGTLTFSWIDNTFAGITQPAGTVIFQACFTATGSDEAVDVTIGNSPVAVEILDVDENLVAATTNNGVVTIGSGNTGGGGDLTFNVSTESVMMGETVCVDITADNFVDIIGAQFTVNYDAAALTYNNVGGFNLPGMTASNFGNPAAGTITFSWTDNSFNGVDVNNGDVLFEACFTASGNAGTYPVTIGNSPVAIEILDVDENIVNASTNAGSVTITGGTGGSDDFTIIVSEETVAMGDNVCVGISVDNFINIIGTQFTVNYDATALNYVEVGAFNLPGMNASNFGNPTPGAVTFSWIDNTFAGVDVPNGTQIFEVCFTAEGNPGLYPVTIGNSPVAVEILDADENLVDATIDNGSVTITGQGGGDDEVTVIVGEETVEQGENVCVDVSVDGFTDIIGAQFTINYNQSDLTFNNFGAFNLPGMNASNFANLGGALTFSWTDNTFNGVDVADGTPIFEVCFTANGSPGTVSPLTIGNSPVVVEFINSSDNEVPAILDNGSVTITDPNATDPNEGFMLTLSEETGFNGDVVCVDMSVNNFGSISGMDFSINYDENLLAYNSVGNFNLTGLGLGDFDVPGSGTSEGEIAVSWSNATGVALPDGTTAFEVCFDLIGGGGTISPVSFSSTPTNINITSGTGATVQTALDHGSVTINSSGGGNTYDDFTFVLSEETAEGAGEEVCVSMEVHQFEEIIGMQFTVTYDPAALDFNSITNFGLNGLSISNFGTPDNGTSPGTITFSWIDNTFAGVTLEDGSTVFDICFTTILDDGSTPVVFSNSPVAIEVLNVDENLVTPDLDNGSVTIGEPVQADGFALFIEDVTTSTGEQICLDVTAQDFEDIAGLQFTINYDPTSLSFNNINSFNLPDLSESNFGFSDGAITFAWIDQQLNGVTLPPNDSTLFVVCFDVIGSNSTTVTFGNSPTPIEANNSMEENVPTNTEDPGVVTLNTAVPPSITNFLSTDVTCNGEDDGVISIDAITGDGPFAYLWSVVDEDGSTISGLAPGDYSVTVVDASTTLLTTMSFSIDEPDPLEISNVNIVDVLCNGDASGEISITVSGGSTPYEINWSNGLPDGLTQTNLEAGIYSVTVTDARGCMVSATYTVEASNNPLNITNMIAVNVPNGAVNITVAGGTGAGTYDYSWSGPGAFSSLSEDISGLTQPGQYCVTVTDNAGCTAEDCVEVGEDILITSFQITNTCIGESQGAIDIEVSGGVGNLNYAWAQNQTPPVISIDQDISGQPAGNYTVTITDENNNSITGSFEIQTFGTLTYGASIGPALGGNDGSVVLNNFQNGTPIAYQWSPNVNNTTFEAYNLSAGTYCVTVTDQNGCETSECYVVPAAPLTFTGEVGTDASCFGFSDGILAVTVNGGVPPYNYEATAGPSPMSNNTGAFMVNTLSAGTVNYTITDAQGTVISGSAVIGHPDPITFNSAVVNDVEGPTCSGKIVLNIEGGTEPYNVTWNAPGIGGTQPIALCGGDYIPSITDANGCELFSNIPIVVSELSDSVSITDVTCIGDENGTINLSPYGAESYSFEWREEGSSTVISNNEDIGDFPPGTYTVEITDETGAVLINTYEIGVQSSLDVNVQVTSDFNGYAVKCSDSSDGTALATGFDGVGDYSYEWELDGDLFGVGANLTNAPAGVYNLIAIDELGCESMEVVTLSAPPVLDVVEAVEDVSCHGLEDGSIEVAGFGGIAEYVYEWSNPNIGSMNNFLVAGDYGLTVTDANGCIITRTYSIAEPSPIEVTITAEPAEESGGGYHCTSSNGAVSAVVTGGTGEYIYNWINIENTLPNQDVVTGLCPGPYYLEVSDSNGCLSEQAFGEVLDRRFPCLEKRVVITPNGDGLNDNFIIFCLNDPTLELFDNHLEIYNRWGQMVYQADNYDNSWEGRTEKGENLPEGPYFYVLEYETPDGLVQEKGSLTIIR